jgi:NADH dehydrogenase FAD-containing subunit
MHQQVKKICVFGAGSAGWTTVLGLQTLLPEIDITIVCSTKHNSFGVG